MADRLDSERLRGFDFRRTDRRTDICDCRVAFATENMVAKLENFKNLMEKQGGKIGKFK